MQELLCGSMKRSLLRSTEHPTGPLPLRQGAFLFRLKRKHPHPARTRHLPPTGGRLSRLVHSHKASPGRGKLSNAVRLVRAYWHKFDNTGANLCSNIWKPEKLLPPTVCAGK